MTFLTRRFRSFIFAWFGIRLMITSEPNARLHLLAAVAVIAAGFYYHINHVEWCLIIGCIASVFAAELFNTTIERVVDLISPTWKAKAGQAKDMAAGAVLVTALGALAMGLIIFIPYIMGK